MGTILYGVFVIISIIVSLRFWLKSSKDDDRLLLVYFGSLAGAFIGAKIAYLLSEGWLYSGENAWRYWLSGKSVTGALLGGFLGVELVKKLVGYEKPTGDKFALIIPFGIIIGRLGCLCHGCCGGVHLDSGLQWPAVPVEIVFNLLIWWVMFQLYRAKVFRYQLFHLYLLFYGVFRFGHEFMRSTPKVILGMSGYQWIALVMIIVALVTYFKRQSNMTQEKGQN